MIRRSVIAVLFCISAFFCSGLLAEDGSVASIDPRMPNIILIYADDISARELPIYGSSVWTGPDKKNTSDPKYRAMTPVLDRMAREGCWFKNAWASVVCSPSRAMMMTGRYAHLHKWWNNKDYGMVTKNKKWKAVWPLYESSPLTIGHVAKQAAYSTYWSGKTQMKNSDLTKFGFDAGCFTPGPYARSNKNTLTDFIVLQKGQDRKTRILTNVDTGKQVKGTYGQASWYWQPSVMLMNDESAPGEIVIWPNTPEAKKNYGLQTYGPDVELNNIFKFMERQKKEDKPFFVYHTSHLGHDGFDWLSPDDRGHWPCTPKIKWDGKSYERTEPKISGKDGDYDTHGTVTENGIHHHINYLDYQVWLYQKKLKELGLEKNTILIFCADNGTSGYGKHSSDRQKGTHVPLIIHAPGLKKTGEQTCLVDMSDILPTIAEVGGVQLPLDYELNGKSLARYLFGNSEKHRDFIYGYSGPKQIIRGELVLRDGFGKWWDVSKQPEDLISFPQIKDWKTVSVEHRAERKRLKGILPRFDSHATEHDPPEAKLKKAG